MLGPTGRSGGVVLRAPPSMDRAFPMNRAVPPTTERGLVDAHLGLALEAGQIGVWEWNLCTRRVAWSLALEEIHGPGGDHGSFSGTFDDFEREIHPDDRAPAREAISRALSERGRYELDYRIVRPDGRVRWLEVRGKLLLGAEGEPERLVGICSDITERKEATLRLQLSEASYSATLMSAGDAVVTVDKAGVVTLMNGVAEALTGWRLDEAKGRPFDAVVRTIPDPSPLSDRLTPRPPPAQPTAALAGDSFPNVPSTAAQVRTEAEPTRPMRVVRFLVRRDGRHMAIDESRAPIRDASGAMVGQVVVFRDVTEERREEAWRWFIADASALLSSSLDFHQTLKSIAQIAVPRIADWCAVHAAMEDGSLQRLVVAHKDAEQLELASRLEKYPAMRTTVSSEVFRTGTSVIVTDITDESLRQFASSEEHLLALRRFGMRSYIVVPLRAGDRILGTMSFVSTRDARLDERDLYMAEEFGRRAGTAMDNARLYEESHRARVVAERSAARANLIREVAAALSEAPTPSIVAEVMTSLGAKAIGAAGATIFQLSADADALLLVRSFGIAEHLLAGFGRIAMSASSVITDCARSGRAMFFSNREEVDARYPGALKPVATFASWAALPLEVEGHVLGAIGITFAEPREFDETERDFMITMSRLCAQALERANLYEAAQKARAEAETSRRTRENLLTVVSHDLRNPLSAIATTASLKFTSDEGTIAVTVEEAAGETRFAVSDTGCGIASDQMPHIFDRYWQAKSARDGVGLGLSIAKGLVDAHAGRIWVKSTVGQGTTFYFALPVAPAVSEERLVASVPPSNRAAREG